MTRFLLGLAKLLAGVAVFALLLERAWDQELASGSPSELQATTDFGVPAGGLTERGVSAVVPMTSRSVSPSGGVGVSLTGEQTTYQGLSAREWARRAVQQRKNSNARGRTIRRLKRELAARKIGPTLAIRLVFGAHASQALRVAWCESRWHTGATNGQYLGLFQMGSYARSRYGHSWSALGQAQAAYRYFVASGRDWSPWACRP